jgi:hypothetical protein
VLRVSLAISTVSVSGGGVGVAGKKGANRRANANTEAARKPEDRVKAFIVIKEER